MGTYFVNKVFALNNPSVTGNFLGRAGSSFAVDLKIVLGVSEIQMGALHKS